MTEPLVKCDRHAEMEGELGRLRALLGKAEKVLDDIASAQWEFSHAIFTGQDKGIVDRRLRQMQDASIRVRTVLADLREELDDRRGTGEE